MARNRWTLALIIISLPILATVITAFRIRDLPKSHDSSKLETKKTQPCEHCYVKVGLKVHSVKLESDKQKSEELQKSVKDKLQNKEKTSDIKSSYEVSDENDDDDNDDLHFPKIRTGFKSEHSKDSKISLSESHSKFKSDTKKLLVKTQTKGYFDSGDDDDDDDDDDDNDRDDDVNNNYSKKSNNNESIKPKTSVTNKIANKPHSSSENSESKDVAKKYDIKTKKRSEEEDDNDDDDEEDDDGDENADNNLKIKQTTTPKTTDTRKILSVNIKSGFKNKHTDLNKKTSEKNTNKDDDNYFEENDDDDDDDDDNDDDDDDDEEDDYKGLENIDELFKILDMKPSSKQKKAIDNKQTSKHQIEIKTQIPDQDKATKQQDNTDMDDDDNDDDDDEDVDDDQNENGNNLRREKQLLKIATKSSSTQHSDKSDTKAKKPELPKQEIDYRVKNQDSISKDTKAAPLPKKTKHEAKNDDKDLKSKSTPSDNKKVDTSKKEDKTTSDASKLKSNDKGKPSEKNNETTDTKKDDKKDVKETSNISDDKFKSDSAKISKVTEKGTSKIPEKDIKSSSHEIKIPSTEPKKDTTDHKEVFKPPENKKDIKYDFEKPNAHKESQRSFDYGEFEKLQVSKSQHKDKKKSKPTETDSDSREEKYLKHVTDALNRRNLLKSEFDDFYAFFPTFAPNFSRIHNPECRRHGQILLRQLRGTKLWALNMLDATAKIPSGVLQGNGIQLGDFDQCLGSRARVQLDTGSVVKVQGRYCLARLELKAEHTDLEAPVYLAQAKSLIRSRIDDPGHFVPRFSTLSWGVCVPAACDREDVEVIVKDALKHYQHKSGLVVKVKVDEDDCHTDEEVGWDDWLELPVLLTLSFYGIVILLVLVATAQDFIARRPTEGQEENGEQEAEQKEEDEKEEPKKQSDNAGILSPFSLYRSLDKLFAPGTTDEISCIHGIRAIATLALLVAHKFMPVAVMPYTNRVKITEVASSWMWSWCRAGWVFTDCFLLLSGTLSAHRIASDANTGAFRRLTSRYLRLTPALLAVVLFYAYIWDKLSTGPMWGTFVTKNAEICEKGWWWNLLYVQNYFGLEDMCAPQTHQLALDMQLTILGAFIVWLMQSGISGSKLILPAFHLTAAYFRYSTVRDHRLTLLAYHGVSVSQLYRTARLSYTSTLHRCSPYFIGISLGLALKKPAKHGKFLLTLGWMSSIGLAALVAWSGLDSGSTQYRYSANFAAQYAAIAPLASAMATAWVIYAVHTGTCDVLSRALCWRPLVFISRLSYALYLCQFIIFITNIGTVRTSREFTLMSLVDVQEIIAILLSSTILTVTFVIPMQSFHKIFDFKWKSESPESPEEGKEKEETKQKTEEQVDPEPEEKKETTPPTRNRHNLVAHREMLEEIPEMEVEYETQREIVTEGLEEILEEEEGTIGEEDEKQIDDLEIIEEEEADEVEEAGEEDHWLGREGERSYSRQDDRDLDEWEWTANGSGRSGAQYYRYSR